MVQNSTLDYLFKLRLVVAWHGEMNRAGWWNTRILGPQGNVVLERGFPRTQLFAQARIAFSVAKARCKDVLAKTDAFSLWALPAELEDQFEERWFEWLDHDDKWMDFIEELEAIEDQGLLPTLRTLNLLDGEHVAIAEGLAEDDPDQRRVPVSKGQGVDEDVLALLAAGFSVGGDDRLVVPYAVA